MVIIKKVKIGNAGTIVPLSSMKTTSNSTVYLDSGANMLLIATSPETSIVQAEYSAPASSINNYPIPSGAHYLSTKYSTSESRYDQSIEFYTATNELAFSVPIADYSQSSAPNEFTKASKITFDFSA